MRTVLASVTVALAVLLLSANGWTAEEKAVEAKVDKALTKHDSNTQRFWVTPEFLMMWSKDGPVRDLFVTRTTNGSQPILTNPAAQRLFDNDEQDYGMQLGGRLTFGLWVDDASKWGVELSGFALEEGDADWTYRSRAGDALGIPVLLTSSGIPASESVLGVAIPGQRDGTVEISSSSQLWGVQGSGLRNIRRSESLTLDASFGFRYLDLSEDLNITSTAQGNLDYQIKDRFDAHNRVYAANLGVKFSYTAWERLLLDVEPSVALGVNDESLDIKGSLVAPALYPAGAPAGGFFASPPTYGNHSKTGFVVVPEIKVGLGCKITKNLSFNARYNFLYASNVVRPGEQINRRVNISHTPAGFPTPYDPTSVPNDPALRFDTTDYWIHGVNVSFKITF